MKKPIRAGMIILTVLLVVYFSLDIRNLDVQKKGNSGAAFNAGEYTADFWENKLPGCLADAVDLVELKRLINNNPDTVCSLSGHRLGISRTCYFYVKGKGIVDSISEEEIVVNMDNKLKAGLITLYIFGNAVRDGSGKVDINTFLNMMDFNAVSVLLNKKVKNEVVGPALGKLKTGMQIEFAGAVETDSEHFDPDYWTLIPLLIIPENGGK